MKKHIVLFLIGVASFNTFANLADILHENPWDVLRYKFETSPNKAANSWSKLFAKSGTAIGSGTLSFFLGKALHASSYGPSLSTFWRPYTTNANFFERTSFNLILPASLTASFVAYTITHNSFVRNIQKKQLRDFLENWNEYKPYVPLSLSDKLNKVHEAYLKNKTGFEEQADEIVDVIVSEVNLHFYGDPKGKSLYDAKFFNTFMTIDIARIIEAGLKCFKAYKKTE